MRLNIVYKLSFSAIFLVLLSTSLVAYVFYYKTTSILVDRALQDIAGEIRLAGNLLVNKIHVQRDDVIFLANTVPVQRLLSEIKKSKSNGNLSANYYKWASKLQLIFTTMLQSKESYFKIRFIDENGQELIVVKREAGKIIKLQATQLQNESQRLYVQRAMSLANGAVLVSEINLNRELGKVSNPHLEVLRTATPVYSTREGKSLGIILLTSEIGQELRYIQNTLQDSSRNIFITNDRGGYLLHPDATKSFGFDLGKKFRIQEDMPHIAKLYLPNSNLNKFIGKPEDGNIQYVVNFIKIYFDPAKPNRFIAVGMTELLSSIVEKQSDVLNDVIVVVLGLAIVVILLAIIFSYRLALPIKQITQVMDDYTNSRESITPMPVKNNDEIGVLARSYQLLMQQVTDAQMNQKILHQNLESMVTERTKELNNSEARQRSIIENMADGLITLTQTGEIESFNPAAQEIFGYSQNDMMGKKLSILIPKLFHSEGDAVLDNDINTKMKNIVGLTQEFQAIRKDSSLFTVELIVTEVTIKDTELFTGIIRDITERENIIRMKDEFVSIVSHELRTPLTSIRGSLGLLTNNVVGELPKAAFELLKIASNNTNRLLFLINDILDIQKLESGHLEFNYEKLNIMALLETVIQDNIAFAVEYDIEFLLHKELDDVFVNADKERLMQVISNLLSNAAKFSPEKTSVDVFVERNSTMLRVLVKDHGEGIPETYQPVLFEKFTQHDSSYSRQKGGSGLGLSITKYIIEHLGGNIGYTTEQGTGTTFYFELEEVV